MKLSALIWEKLWRIQMGEGGRPPFDPVLMFRILVIQALNSLSDERTEYLINDHLSFMRFFRLGLSDRVPDAKAVWLFRERLTRASAIERLFDRFDAILRDAGYLPMSGQILDATPVAAPKQRNTNGERADLRAGRGGFEKLSGYEALCVIPSFILR